MTPADGEWGQAASGETVPPTPDTADTPAHPCYDGFTLALLGDTSGLEGPFSTLAYR